MSQPAPREVTVDGQQRYGESVFPVAIHGTSTGFSEWVSQNRQKLNARLNAAGALLFRGFGLSSAGDFDAFVSAFEYPNFTYAESLSNAVRVNLTDRVFTANEAPPDVRIHLHHEMAQTPIFPSRLFFFCEQAPESGGATPLCRSDELLDRLRDAEPRFVVDCEQKGLRYSNVMPAHDDASSGMGRSWRSTLGADNADAAEARLAGLGYSWEWLEDESLRATTPVLPAIRVLDDGRTSFFNQLIAASQGWKDDRNDPSRAITHGDGSPLNFDAVRTAVQIADELTFDLQWQSGDVALVDNYRVMHARRPFTGTRRVLASLVAAD